MTEEKSATEVGGPPMNRRKLLKAAGAGAITVSAFSGSASATDLGVSWVAFCGCDATPCIRFINQQSDDESITELAYSDENCNAVYYKMGKEVHQDNTYGSDLIVNSDEPDCLVLSGNDPHVNRDPCGTLSGDYDSEEDCPLHDSNDGVSVKLEAEEILDDDGNVKDEYRC